MAKLMLTLSKRAKVDGEIRQLESKLVELRNKQKLLASVEQMLNGFDAFEIFEAIVS